MYFIVSAIQMISGYPRRLLGYFVGESYSTISGVIFIGLVAKINSLYLHTLCTEAQINEASKHMTQLYF